MNNVPKNSRYLHYKKKLKFEYNRFLGKTISAKYRNKCIKKTNTLARRIRIRRGIFLPSDFDKEVFETYKCQIEYWVAVDNMLAAYKWNLRKTCKNWMTKES